MDSLKGKLLLAGGGLFDPSFRRTVVLVGEHNDDGAIGVVLNRPAPVLVSESVPPMSRIVGPDEPLYVGGPVEPRSPVLLAELEDPAAADLLVFGSVGFLTGTVDSGVIERVLRARVFAGHAGWGAGQLEDEIEEGAWIVEPAAADDVFTGRPERLWRTILERRGGAFRLLALMPHDPSTN